MKIKKWMFRCAAVVGVAVLCFSAYACNKTDDTPAEIVMLNSFETYEDLLTMKWSRLGGKAKMNENAEFVTNGKSSLAVYPQGDYESNVVPRLTMSTRWKQFPVMDFTDFESVCVDVFNSGEKDSPVKFYVVCQDSEGREIDMPVNHAVLPAGEWYKFSYDFFGGAYKSAYPIDRIVRFAFEFLDYRQSAEPWNPAPIYFDNFVGYKKAQTYAPIREEKELLFFENPGDIGLTAISNNLQICSTGVSMFVSQGKNAAKIERISAGQCSVKFYSSALDSEKLKSAKNVSIDVFNADSAVKAYVLEAVFLNKDTLAEIPVRATLTVFGCTWGTLTLQSDALPAGYAFEDVAWFKLSFDSDVNYIDNFRVGL